MKRAELVASRLRAGPVRPPQAARGAAVARARRTVAAACTGTAASVVRRRWRRSLMPARSYLVPYWPDRRLAGQWRC